MSNLLRYKGYQARVDFDAEDGLFFGHIGGIKDRVSFHSGDVDGLVAAFHEAVEDYLETCARVGKAPDRAFSGNVFLRVDQETHAKVALAAELSGKSLNEFGAEVLNQAADKLLHA